MWLTGPDPRESGWRVSCGTPLNSLQDDRWVNRNISVWLMNNTDSSLEPLPGNKGGGRCLSLLWGPNQQVGEPGIDYFTSTFWKRCFCAPFSEILTDHTCSVVLWGTLWWEKADVGRSREGLRENTWPRFQLHSL